jgi:UDP-glucose 4-epimerase
VSVRCLVTGCAGFIGSNLADRLLRDGHQVIGYDNFSTGQDRFISEARRAASFRMVQGDVLDLAALRAAMAGVEMVFHLAANADVRHGTEQTGRDLQQNTIATWNVLEAMRLEGVKKIVFSSTGSVYGEATVIPTPEDAPFPLQTSLYGAAKVAGEALIQAFCEGFGMQGWIFRFVSILGERYSHGHVFDFYRSLRADPAQLTVLGNGKQRKSYLYVQDCLDAILLAVEKAPGRVQVFNLGTDEYCQVDDSIGWICGALGLAPERRYTGGERGWIGDNPFIYLDCRKIRALGWTPKLTIRQGVTRTLDYLQANPWLLEGRS